MTTKEEIISIIGAIPTRAPENNLSVSVNEEVTPLQRYN